jgi:hypothetical protein
MVVEQPTTPMNGNMEDLAKIAEIVSQRYNIVSIMQPRLTPMSSL